MSVWLPGLPQDLREMKWIFGQAKIPFPSAAWKQLNPGFDKLRGLEDV